MVKEYGEPRSLRDFSTKMQMVNANGYRGIFEAVGHKINQTGGVMLWKLNAAFPSVVWQIYDWYLEPNAGYYFMQNACEPVHIQLNLDDSSVAVTNRTYLNQNNLSYNAEVFNLQGKSLIKKQGKLNIDTIESKIVFSLSDFLRNNQGICFVVLKLQDATGKNISDNTYWIAPGNDFTSLNQMPRTKISTKIISLSEDENFANCELELSNPSSQLAFFINPQWIADGEEVLPSYWSSNYLSLAPGETRRLKVSCPLGIISKAHKQAIRLEGWNIEEINSDLKFKLL